jgi:hypothetical protein
MAKLKEGVELQPYGERSKVFSGEIDNQSALYFLESGKASPEDFEELPSAEEPKEAPKKKSK